MDVVTVIHQRRSYRSLDPVDISRDMIEDLARSAQLAPSCFNYQPWRFVFVTDKELLDRIFEVFSSGNAWARRASMVIAVVSRPDLDCVIGPREYFLYDTGCAVGFLILRAWELGLVAHPIAGFSESKTRRVLGIPEDMRVITLLICGKKVDILHEELSDKQRASEQSRPARSELDSFAFMDAYASDQ